MQDVALTDTIDNSHFVLVCNCRAGDWGNFWLIKAGYSGVQLVNQSRLSCTLMGTLPPHLLLLVDSRP